MKYNINYLRSIISRFIFVFVISFTISFEVLGDQEFPSLICKSEKIPAGADFLKYTNQLFRFCPSDLDIGNKGDLNRFYYGLWFMSKNQTSDAKLVDGVLVLHSGTVLASIQNDMSLGLLPLLQGNKGFYVEFQAAISDNDRDHWPSLFLMPVEHGPTLLDHYKNDPKGFQRWFELDVDEGGFGPGLHGTAISWQGIWPDFKKIQNSNASSPKSLDRTTPHVFGVSFDPKSQSVSWWLDDEFQMTASSPFVPDVALKQNFYLIVSAQMRKAGIPYELFLYGIRAYAPN